MCSLPWWYFLDASPAVSMPGGERVRRGSQRHHRSGGGRARARSGLRGRARRGGTARRVRSGRASLRSSEDVARPSRRRDEDLARERAPQRRALGCRGDRGDGRCGCPQPRDGAGARTAPGDGRRVQGGRALADSGRRGHQRSGQRSERRGRSARDRQGDECEGIARPLREVRAGAEADDAAWARRLHVERRAHEWSDPNGAYRVEACMAADAGARFSAAWKAHTDRIFQDARRAGRHEPRAAYAADALVALATEGPCKPV